MEEKLTFEEVCRYAELEGYEHREGPSRAKDMTQLYVKAPWNGRIFMVLYEAPKRTLKGHDEPEVCWWVIGCHGDIHSEASRNIRRMKLERGFSFTDEANEHIKKYIRGGQHNV